MKKFLSIILVFCVAASFTACGGNNSEAKGELTENYESTTNEFTETTTMSETTEATEAPFPEGMGKITKSKKSISNCPKVWFKWKCIWN